MNSFAQPTIPTSTVLTSNPSPSCSGTAVTLTATVSPNAASGSVGFFNASGTNIGNGTLTAGVATFTTSTLPIGTTGLYAIYQGDLTYIGSTAITINHTVNSTPTISTHPSPATDRYKVQAHQLELSLK